MAERPKGAQRDGVARGEDLRARDGREPERPRGRRNGMLRQAAYGLAALAASTVAAGPAAQPALAQSLPSDAMLSRSFSDRTPNMLLSSPLKALKVATLDLPPAIGSGLGFTVPDSPAATDPARVTSRAAPKIPARAEEDGYAYPPPLVLDAPVKPAETEASAPAAAPPSADPSAAEYPARASALAPAADALAPVVQATRAPEAGAAAEAVIAAPTSPVIVAALPDAAGAVPSVPAPALAAATPDADDAAPADAETPALFGPAPVATNGYLEIALDSLLSLPGIEDQMVASDDASPELFGPDISGADVDPNALAAPERHGGIGSDALFPTLPDDQGWADLGTGADGEESPLYRDRSVVFGVNPDVFPAQPFEHSLVSIPASLVPMPLSPPPERGEPLFGRTGPAGATFAERLGLTGPDRARAEKCLAEAIYFESRGEPKRGQIAVAQVVMNRVFSGYYPNDVCKTVYQNAHRHLACQFTFACDDVKDVVREPDMWVQAKEIAADMLDGKLWLDSVGPATHYHAYWVHPSWVREMRKLDRIGVHTFYRPKRWAS